MVKHAKNNHVVFTDNTVAVGEIVLDVASRTVRGGSGETYELTPMECNLLKLLMRHAGTPVSFARIMKEVWETDYLGDIRTLYAHVWMLRQKIEHDPSTPQYLQTIRGLGYEFVSMDEVAAA